MTHVTKFKEFLVAWDITNEDTMMQLFVMSLVMGGSQDVDDWYEGIPPIYNSLKHFAISGILTIKMKP